MPDYRVVLDSSQRDIAGPLADGDARVTVVHPGREPIDLALPRPAAGAVLVFRWTETPSGSVMPGLVELAGCRPETNDSLLMRLSLGRDERGPYVIWRTTSHFDVIRVCEARLEVADGTLEALGEIALGPDATVSSIDLRDIAIAVCEGEIGALPDGDGVAIERADRAAFARRRRDPLLTLSGRLRECVFADTRLAVGPDAQVEGASGSVRLVSCHSLLRGDTRQDHMLTVAVDRSLGSGAALERAWIMDVVVDPQALKSITAATEQLRVFDPVASSLFESLQGVPREERATVAEQVHDCVSSRAKRPQTVDTAAIAVLDVRRRLARPWHSDWLLLSAYCALGYGRRVGRALMIWLGVVLCVFAYRLAIGFRHPGGALAWHDGPTFSLTGRSLSFDGDVVLSIVALPVTWTVVSNANSGTYVGLENGYLACVRIAMLVPLIAAAAAGRRRIRVRPSTDDAGLASGTFIS